MRQGEIWMADLEPTRGREQRGRRPVLIVSRDRFNTITQLPVILPVTNGGGFATRLGFTVPLTDTKTTGVVRCDQPRVLDLKDRGARLVEMVPPGVLQDVLARLTTIFE
jgi:mRNA interferase ChpB